MELILRSTKIFVCFISESMCITVLISFHILLTDGHYALRAGIEDDNMLVSFRHNPFRHNTATMLKICLVDRD